MIGKTHLAAGIFTGSALSFIHNTDIKTSLLLTAGTALGSLLPDIDKRNSLISRALKPLGMIVEPLLGHRTLLHDPVFYITLFGMFHLTLEQYLPIFLPIFWGVGSHLLLDALTLQGIPFFYFLKLTKVRPKKIRLLKIRTGAGVDRALGSIFFIAAMAFFALHFIKIFQQFLASLL